MRPLNRPALIIAAAFLVLLFTTSPAWPPNRAAFPRAVGANERGTVLPGVTSRPALPTVTPALATRVVPTPIPPTPAPPVTPTPGMPTTPLGLTLDTYLRDLVRANLFSGTVLVARDGQVLLDAGYGYADVARAIPNTPQTRFQIASMTKQFTALAVLQLVARGQLALSDSVCAYLDDCPPAWQPITLRQLLNHTSGLPNYTDFASFDATQMLPATPAELVARFRDVSLLSVPGSAYMYENSDYVLLGLVIERVSGMSYGEFLRANIFAPLGMESTGAAGDGAPASAQAQGYRMQGELAPPLDPSTLFSAGGMHSTSHDLYLWDQALYTDALLPQPLRDELWTPGLGNYGFGWKSTIRNGRREISHPGLMDGFASVIARYPDERVTVIVLGNMSASDPEGIADYLADLVFDSL